MKLLHLCYWELEGLDLSQTFCSPREVSNYWNVAVNGVYPNDRDPFYLQEAEQLFGPDIAKALADQKRRVQVNKEETFENVRQAEYPDRPSRRSCMFAFLSKDPEAYMAAFNWTKEQFHLVEIELVGPDTKHFAADHTILNRDVMQTQHEIEEKARLYWNGTGLDNPNAEILVEGLFKVSRVIWRKDAAPSP